MTIFASCPEEVSCTRCAETWSPAITDSYKCPNCGHTFKEIPGDLVLATVDDVKEFFRHLLYIEGVNLHPDTPFDDYIEHETRGPLYSEDQARQREKLMEQAFAVTTAAGFDIYALLIEIYNEYEWSQAVAQWTELQEVKFPHQYSPCHHCSKPFESGKIDRGMIFCSQECWQQA